MSKAIALPMAGGNPPLKLCTECGKCCTYVAVGINPPTGPRYATDILWYLYHDRVSVWLDSDGEWSVLFETRCRNLADDLLCRIYEDRPHICRAFDNQTCDVNDPSGGTAFTTPEEFLEFLEAWKPAVYRKVSKGFLPEALRPKPAG
jgi:uncharacterized protein